MSNEIKIEDIKRDDRMYVEKHYNNSCDIVKRDGLYTHYTEGRRRILQVRLFFMDCHCRTAKSRNLLRSFDEGHSIKVGQSVDPHLYYKKCSYERCTETNSTEVYYWFKCNCKCRHQSLSFVR